MIFILSIEQPKLFLGFTCRVTYYIILELTRVKFKEYFCL